MKFVIDRSKWLRGEGPVKSFLLREDGKMCCMGQVAQQKGVPIDLLLNVGGLSSLTGNPSEPGPCLDQLKDMQVILGGTYHDHHWIGDAYVVNDDQHINDTSREGRLIELFTTNGHELQFVN